MNPRTLAVVVAVALVAGFAAVDAVRPDPAPRPAAVTSSPLPALPRPTSRHVQQLIQSDIRLQTVRADRRYCRRDLTVLCFRDRSR